MTNHLRTRSGSILLLTIAALWIKFPTGCKKSPALIPERTVNDFFIAAKICNKAKIRTDFSPALLTMMDNIYKQEVAILGKDMKLDMISGMCKAYKNAKWQLVSKKITGKTASIAAKVNNQHVRFFLTFHGGDWRINAIASPDYRIDEKGLHPVK